jgi:alpha-glucosidase
VVARQPRGGRDWFLGAVTDEQARTVTVALDFLEPGRRYEAQIYRDGEGASYLTDPYAFETDRRMVTATDSLTIRMGAGGGQAVRFRALD